MKMCRKVLKNTQAHIDTNNQPTKKTKGDRNQRQASQRTNTPITIYTNKNRNNKTTRPLESSFELQTQTQTPAAGCSPKAT